MLQKTSQSESRLSPLRGEVRRLSDFNIDDVADDWRALAARAPRHSMAQTPEFASVALDVAKAGGNDSYLITVHNDERLVGIWCLIRRRHWIHSILEPCSCGSHEEMSGPLIEDDRIDVAEALISAALSMKADRVAFYNLPKDGAVDYVLGRLRRMQFVDPINSYVLSRERFSSWSDVEASISKSFRSQLRRYEKKLASLGELKFGFAQTVEDAHEVIDFIYETKRAWLAAKGLKSFWLGKDDVRDFFKALVGRVDIRNKIIVSWIKLDGRPIAGGLHLCTDEWVESLVTTSDPTYADVSCGNILLKHCIALSLSTGRSYDIGLGQFAYKERWSASSSDSLTRVVALSAKGALLSPYELSMRLRRLLSFRTRLRALKTALRKASGAEAH